MSVEDFSTVNAVEKIMRRGLSSLVAARRLLPRRSLSSQTLTPLLPPRETSTPPRLTLCLDLDECLVHCTVAEGEASFMEVNGAEEVRRAAQHNVMHRRHNARPIAPPDFELELPYLDEPVRVHKRPQLDDFLHEAAKMCEVVLFTSAAETYANACAELLDPEGRLFSALLTREHCTNMDQLYIKDLSRLGRPLERVVCVDDHVGSCLLQPSNAVPVAPYLGDPIDQELPHVLSVLHRLRDAEDVREPLQRMYNLQALMLSRVRAAKAAQ